MTANAKASDVTKRRLRLGMVGGGPGAFIGSVHRLAARMDDHFELVAAALTSDPERSRAAALDLHLPPERADLRTDAQLHGLSRGAAGARDDRSGRVGADTRGASGVRPRLADHGSGGDGAKTSR